MQDEVGFPMSAEKKKNGGKARRGFIGGSWRDKVNPVFVDWWSSQKKNRALGKIKDTTEFKRHFYEWKKEAAPLSRAIIEARRQIKESVGGMLLAEIMKGMFTEGPSIGPPVDEGEEGQTYAENPESSPFFRWLVFFKYGITFRELICQIDIEKSPAAHRKLMAVHRDYWKMISGHSHKDLKLRFNWDHFFIITEGLDFGLDQLTPEELCDCLDEICPCAQRHSDQYLKKVRTAIMQACLRYRRPLNQA
jgi:hypothetical protein